MDFSKRKQLAGEVRRYVFSQGVIENTPENFAEEARRLGQNAKAAVHRNYNNAVVAVREIGPAWDSLTDTQQYILREFYGQASKNTGATQRVVDFLCVSKRQVFRLCAVALKEFDANLVASHSELNDSAEGISLWRHGSPSHAKE